MSREETDCIKRSQEASSSSSSSSASTLKYPPFYASQMRDQDEDPAPYLNEQDEQSSQLHQVVASPSDNQYYVRQANQLPISLVARPRVRSPIPRDPPELQRTASPVRQTMVVAQTRNETPSANHSGTTNFSEEKIIIKCRYVKKPRDPEKVIKTKRQYMELKEDFIQLYHTIGANDVEKIQMCQSLLSLDVETRFRYDELDLQKLLDKNLVRRAINCLTQTLGILEKYASNMIKPNRPTFWKTVKFTSSLVKTYLENVQGSHDVLMQMGYTKKVPDGLAFPDDVLHPDTGKIKILAADLFLAKYEVDELVHDRHPYLIILPLVSSPEPTNIKLTSAITSEDSESEYEDAEDGLHEAQNTKVQPMSSALEVSPPDERECHVCDKTGVKFTCEQCQDVFCADCVQTFHKKKSRYNHKITEIGGEGKRESSPSTSNYENVATSDRIMKASQFPPRVVKRPVPTPRKNIPTSPKVSVGKPHQNATGGSNVSHLDELPPPQFIRKPYTVLPVAQNLGQQASTSMRSREIKRPPPFAEPTVPDESNEDIYESLKSHAEHLYETLDHSSGNSQVPKRDVLPPPLPPPRLQQSAETVTSCPTCFCLNEQNVTKCVACGTLLIRDQQTTGSSTALSYNVNQTSNATNLPTRIVRSHSGTLPEQAFANKINGQLVPNMPGKPGSPATMSRKWMCQHCTFHNDMSTKICEMCAKTTDNPVEIQMENASSPVQTPISPTSIPYDHLSARHSQYNRTSPRSDYDPTSPRSNQSDPMSQRINPLFDPVSSKSGYDPTSPRSNQSDPMSPRINPLFDPVSPKSGYDPTSPRSNQSDPVSPRINPLFDPVSPKSATEPVSPRSNLSDQMSPRLASTASLYYSKPQFTSQRNDTLSKTTSLIADPLYSKTVHGTYLELQQAELNMIKSTNNQPYEQQLQQQTHKTGGEQAENKFTVFPSGLPQRFQSYSSQSSSSGYDSHDSKNVVEQIEQFENNDMKVAGEQFVKLMKEAETLGFTAEELNIAYNLNQDESKGPIYWLKTEWFDRIHQVMLEFTKVSQDENYGNVSPEEARSALIEHTGVVKDANEKCVKDRKQKLTDIMKAGVYIRTEVIKALDNNDGDVDLAIQQLQRAAFEPMLDRIKNSCVHDNVNIDDDLQQRLGVSRQMSTSQDEEIFEGLVSNKEIDMDRRIRVMFAEKSFVSWGRAMTAIKLIDMAFPVSDSIEAAKVNGDLERSLQYLQRECTICCDTYPESRMIAMLNCQCRFCQPCVSQYFNQVIHEQNIMKLVCPQCSEPKNLEDDTLAAEYFNHVDILIRRCVDRETHDLFQRKLRDRTLMKEPNFRWCSHCSSGFINEQPQILKMACPNCKKYTCFKCKKQWEDQHEGITCEQFAAWKEANDPEAQANGLAAHLKQNGIECPNCKFRYDLAKGGCMHFKCVQCSHEFCSGCYQPFRHNQHCRVSQNCARRGLHAHHPRDCLFYLRDRDPEELKKLLNDNNVQYNTEPPQRQQPGQGEEVQGAVGDPGRCKVMEQREVGAGLEDAACGRETPQGYAGLCRLHFIEYLVERINSNHIDPVAIFDIGDLRAIFQRNDLEMPPKQPREKDKNYHTRMVQYIQEKLPLPKKSPRRRVLNVDDEIPVLQARAVNNPVQGVEQRDGGGQVAEYDGDSDDDSYGEADFSGAEQEDDFGYDYDSG